MIFQSLVMIFPRFFDFETITKSPGKNWKIWRNFVTINMMNKCAKFHKDSPSDKKVKFNLPSAIELLEMANFVYNFRNLMQASNFGGTFDQLFLWIFLWNFHRRCVSTSSIPKCKRVKNDPKLKSRGSPPPLNWVFGCFLLFYTMWKKNHKRICWWKPLEKIRTESWPN